MPWDQWSPVRVRFGAGALDALPEAVSGSTLLVTTKGATRRGWTDQVRERVPGLLVFDGIMPNPSLAAMEAARRHVGGDVDCIVALGGGSTIDAAKALSLMLASGNEGTDLRHALEDGEAWPNPAPVPLVAIPTTAGTGSEVTPFATIWDDRRLRKLSLASESLYPGRALLDPELTASLPAAVTAASGLDALSHSLESLWSRRATPFTRALACRALQGILESLPRRLDRPGDAAAREEMMFCSMLAGMAIARSRTALAHAVSYPLTARFGVPHGFACSFTLAALLRFNAGGPGGGALESAARAAGLTGTTALADAVQGVLERCGAADEVVGRTGGWKDIERLLPEMFTPGRADNNLRDATDDDVRRILLEAVPQWR